MFVCCPECNSSPDASQIWKCFCGESFNHFKNIGKCPSCGYNHEFTECLQQDCKTISLHLDWYPTVKANINDISLNLGLILS